MAADGGSRLAQLRTLSVVVADTGDLEAVRRLRPVDCTTNPSLVRKALDLPVHADLVEAELAWGRTQSGEPATVAAAVVDRLTVAIGARLLALIPGRVSTEVDADLSLDTDATVAKARALLALYAAHGIGRERVLIKIAATWAGIRAVEVLQREGIDCNVTLVFNHAQALACAEAGAFLLSPFVGRILDWHVARGEVPADIEHDPGVLFVRRVYDTFKRRGLSTVVMAASFRSTAQVEALAGCDRLTIAPDLLDALERAGGHLPRRLHPTAASETGWVPVDQAAFARALADDAMAREKLDEGIAAFTADLLAIRISVEARLRG
ncbi:MAG TPA: transaldolase family protein [Luteimonas sp.]|nr:transaldolase family protein [Luteimonas sp.]